MDLQELIEKREEVFERQKELHETAVDEHRDLTVAEDREWSKLNSEFDILTGKIDALKEQRVSDYVPVFQRGGDGIAQMDFDELNKLMHTENRTFKNMNMEKRIEVDDKELRAFGEFCLKGETRTLQKDLDAAGGFMVLPQTLYGQVLHDMDNMVHIRKLAKIFRVSKADGVGVPVMDTDISDPDFTGEITEASLDTSMDFERRDLKPNRLVKGIKVSRDLLNLSTPDAAKFIMGRGTYKLAVAQENAFLNGSGAGLNPLGIFTTSDLGVSSGRNVSDGNTNTAITADGLINCMYNLKAQYLSSPNCRWIFHRDGLKMIRKLKDGEGNYLWQPGIGQDRPSTILGIPYLLSEYAPNTFTTTLRVGCICDLNFYGIAEYGNISVQTLLEKYALENCNAYIFQHHVDGMPLIEEAFSMVTLT